MNPDPWNQQEQYYAVPAPAVHHAMAPFMIPSYIPAHPPPDYRSSLVAQSGMFDPRQAYVHPSTYSTYHPHGVMSQHLHPANYAAAHFEYARHPPTNPVQYYPHFPTPNRPVPQHNLYAAPAPPVQQRILSWTEEENVEFLRCIARSRGNWDTVGKNFPQHTLEDVKHHGKVLIEELRQEDRCNKLMETPPPNIPRDYIVADSFEDLSTKFEIAVRCMVSKLLMLKAISCETLKESTGSTGRVSSIRKWIQGRELYSRHVRDAGELICLWYQANATGYSLFSLQEIKERSGNDPEFYNTVMASPADALHLRDVVFVKVNEMNMSMADVATACGIRNVADVVMWMQLRNASQRAVGVAGELLIKWCAETKMKPNPTVIPNMEPKRKKHKLGKAPLTWVDGSFLMVNNRTRNARHDSLKNIKHVRKRLKRLVNAYSLHTSSSDSDTVVEACIALLQEACPLPRDENHGVD